MMQYAHTSNCFALPIFSNWGSINLSTVVASSLKTTIYLFLFLMLFNLSGCDAALVLGEAL